jgi:SAM-dependent methyltransferase
MTFEAEKFDVIVCAGVLHHLDAGRAFQELARVVKPSGQIIAIEALGYNPIIRAYRKLTPHLRTAWEIDHILTRKELKVSRKYFRRLKVNYFHLFSVAATPLRNTPFFQPVLRVLNALDRIVLKIPGLQLMAWQMIFVLDKPVKPVKPAARS